MQPEEFADAIAEILINASQHGHGIRVKADAPFTTLELFLGYSPKIAKALKDRGYPHRLSYHADCIRIVDDTHIRVGDHQFSINRRYSKTAIRRAVTENYRKKHGIADGRPLPKGSVKQIQLECEEVMRQMEAVRTSSKETP